ARVLDAVPGSRLLLKWRELDQPATRKRITDMFAALGVGADRMELRTGSSHEAMLAEYADIDVALDPFPFCGGVTSSEALWMGVPVVTCPGQTFAGRHSLSHLASAGLAELVAADPEGYVALAVGLAADLPRLARLRGRLRGQ